MSPPPLLYLSKRFPCHLPSISASTPKDRTPLCCLAQPKLYSTWRTGKTLTTLHAPWPTASSPPYTNGQTSPTSTSRRPIPTSTNSMESFNSRKLKSANCETGEETLRCPPPMSETRVGGHIGILLEQEEHHCSIDQS